MNHHEMNAVRNKYVKSVLWIIFYLAIIDVSVNVIFRFPERPWKTPPSFLQGYFEYGRSVEGKLEKLRTRASAQSSPILGYGWLRDKKYEALPRKAGENQVLVAVYGMSHTKLLGEAMEKVDRKYVVRDITGPGVPPGWCLAAYEEDKDQHEAKVVIMGIMTENVAYVSATSGATSYFDMSHPYTFPRYYAERDKLRPVYPPFFTEAGFKEYLLDRSKWVDYTNWLERNDKYYDPFLFKKSVTDASAVCRVLRRAYSQRLKERLKGHLYNDEGFNAQSEELIALKKILERFALSAREHGRIPIIYIVNNQRRGDHLYRVLRPFLEANRIPFLSTHTICPPDNPRIFLENSHFTPAKDLELAREMIAIIEGNLE
jgi:hypothetical protein